MLVLAASAACEGCRGGPSATWGCADLAGNIITGKLNLGPTEGSAWWWSHQHGWQIIDPDIANTNGPAVGVIDGSMTSSGLDRTLLLPVTNPTDVTFGGPSLGRLY